MCFDMTFCCLPTCFKLKVKGHRSRSKVKFKMSFSCWRGVVYSGMWFCQVQQKIQWNTSQVPLPVHGLCLCLRSVVVLTGCALAVNHAFKWKVEFKSYLTFRSSIMSCFSKALKTCLSHMIASATNTHWAGNLRSHAAYVSLICCAILAVSTPLFSLLGIWFSSSSNSSRICTGFCEAILEKMKMQWI